MSKLTTCQFNVTLTHKAKWFLKFVNQYATSCHYKDIDRL